MSEDFDTVEIYHIGIWVAINAPPSKDYPLLMKDIAAGWGRVLPITANMQ